MQFDPHCRRCPRLAGHLASVKVQYPDYHARPVPAFGDDNPQLLIVGLAPGMHGANRTGRPFTGDYAGILLYQTLYEFGFSNGPVCENADDGLRLVECRITNAVKCLPPENKPAKEEIRCCNSYLAKEFNAFSNLQAVLILGTVAHEAVLRAKQLSAKDCPFAHGAIHVLPSGLKLYDSYHCSRYNTQTRRLTATMFEAVVANIRTDLELTPQ
ncbi:MAG: uracil-DNA glycosylase [Burkholderiales bacterium]|nr:uracil-DNA glycosylase [Burkholderiales bacterium]